ncbi:DUF2480 family protein [Solitalea canadensis]|uniref:DUF2480 family protein n=1 Tax=Solitalea canadensis (strain ATCC 29591 / DSM 3403 / JCM 21819 / LMG 8368 / NBRC 15130 / NCIMB 12057 / USAM 9D) TaxID=929556 RepID=H8KMA5_SOLCM|nr:DUF2480 family protein [Solitalea canadensis]AFD09287.1 Protein of unknown function (DUF2480) [Solitalea canadensis DSM 3403]
MEIQETIINKVANSGLITFDLSTYYHKGERIVYDIKDNLFHGLILREKDFREFVKEHDWTQYEGKNVAILCSTDAIVPTWAYMLLSSKIEPYANRIVFGNLEALESVLYLDALSEIDLDQYKDQRIVVKGCGDIPVPVSAYVEVTNKLRPIAKSIMFGEPCSTVPIYKRKD